MQIHSSTAYKAWEKTARMDAMTQLPVGFKIIAGQVRVKVLAYYKGSRPDLSGAYESVGDCLEGIVWENDRQIESWDGDSRLIHDKKNPRTEVTVMMNKEIII